MSTLNHQWFQQLPFKHLESFQPVSGGDINESYRIEADGQSYFIKIQPNQPAKYFQHEINGLKAIGKVINTPTPIHNGEINGNAYLVLNWLDERWQPGRTWPSRRPHAPAVQHQRSIWLCRQPPH